MKKPYGNLSMISEKPCTNLVLKRNLSIGYKLSTIRLFTTLFLASCSHPTYASDVQQKAVGLALTGYNSNGAQSANRAFFVRIISMRSHISMAKLERDTFTCAGIRLSLSVNPFQLCHLYLLVNGKASYLNGAYRHV